MPTPSGSQPTAWVGGWAFAIPSNAKNPVEAGKLLEFLASEDFAEAFIKGSQTYALENGQSIILPGALYFAYPNLVRKLHVPELVRHYPKTTAALAHFLDVRINVYRVYPRESTPIQNDAWNMVNDAFSLICMQGEVPEAVLEETQRLLQAKLDEAWAAQE